MRVMKGLASFFEQGNWQCRRPQCAAAKEQNLTGTTQHIAVGQCRPSGLLLAAQLTAALLLAAPPTAPLLVAARPTAAAPPSMCE